MPLSEANCPHCGRPLSPGAPEGLCPACLMASLSDLMGEGGDGTSFPSMAAPRERLGGYELIEEIGRGGMGAVFRARDLQLNREVAIKLILTGQLASEAEVKRFLNEAEVAAQLEHPNIVPIYEVGEAEGRHFFAMKLVEGGTLAERISNLRFQMATQRSCSPPSPAPSTTPTSAASCIGISSRGTSCWMRTASRWWRTSDSRAMWGARAV